MALELESLKSTTSYGLEPCWRVFLVKVASEVCQNN